MAVCQPCTGEYVKLQEVIPNEDGVGDDQWQELHAEDDVQLSKALNTPVLPLQVDLDFHTIDHIPYRAWCGSCVGAGVAKRRRTIRWNPVAARLR